MDSCKGAAELHLSRARPSRRASAGAGKYTKDNLPGGQRSLVINKERVDAVQPLLGLMRDIGSAHGNKTPGQACSLPACLAARRCTTVTAGSIAGWHALRVAANEPPSYSSCCGPHHPWLETWHLASESDQPP